jgi:hypothetical protein
MRFFTMDWWCGLQAGERSDPAGQYAAHLDSVRDRLPPDLLATEEAVSLHDARLRELRLVPAERTLTLGLDSHGGDERLTLTYAGVERFDSTADPAVGLPGPAGYGDLGYGEVDALPGGAFEHRLLFSTGIELAVVFRGFRLLRGGHTAPTLAAADPATAWAVWRIDDNANTFLVQGGLGRAEAERLAAEFTARGHKQTYWVEPEAPGEPAAAPPPAVE